MTPAPSGPEPFRPERYWDRTRRPPPEPAHGDIAVALSGGGNRAALFALGMLLYLVDTGLNKRVALISSVSGGSITNGFVAQAGDFATMTPEQFDRVASDLLDRIVRRGLFHGSWLVGAYFFVLAAGSALAISAWKAGWPLPLPGWGAALAVAFLALMGLLRGTIISLELSRRFFTVDGKRTRLTDLPRSVEHIFCATDISSGVPFYFSTWSSG